MEMVLVPLFATAKHDPSAEKATEFGLEPVAILPANVKLHAVDSVYIETVFEPLLATATQLCAETATETGLVPVPIEPMRVSPHVDPTPYDVRVLVPELVTSKHRPSGEYAIESGAVAELAGTEVKLQKLQTPIIL
jgi:hypothetical protein